MLRRLFDDLEQGVEPLGRDHVGLVDDEHPVAGLGGHVERLFPQLPGVVDATVTGRVQLHHIQRARALGRQRDTTRTHAARVGGRALHAVQRAGQDPSRAGLAAAPRSGEQVRVVDPAGRQGDPQWIGDVRLAHDLGERRRAVLPVQSQRHADDPTSWPRQSVSVSRRRPAARRRGTPAPARAHGPLLPSGPGGVDEMDAAGVPGSLYRSEAKTPSRYTPMRRIRLVAYGARLECVLG